MGCYFPPLTSSSSRRILTDHGDDEVHEDYVPDYQNEEPEEEDEDGGQHLRFKDL